ncbi:hypothetical protein [Kaarinaea lacus]
MNRYRLVLFIILLLIAVAAEAGRIYGSLQVNGKAVAQGTQVSVNCSGQSYTTQVGKHGRYSVNVGREGVCTISVEGYAGASTDLVSYKEATRYNFTLASSGGSYTMKRN